MAKGIYRSPLGVLEIEWQENTLTRLDFCPGEGEEPIPAPLARWLDAYFRGENPGPAPLALAPSGTPFQERVWKVLAGIPYGTAVTYGELAAQVAAPGQNPRLLARAVGRAVGANPILILLPCHRVVGAKGRLTGFRAGLEIKKRLLAGEGSLPGQKK